MGGVVFRIGPCTLASLSHLSTTTVAPFLHPPTARRLCAWALGPALPRGDGSGEQRWVQGGLALLLQLPPPLCDLPAMSSCEFCLS
jgi:hypothetical protein